MEPDAHVRESDREHRGYGHDDSQIKDFENRDVQPDTTDPLCMFNEPLDVQAVIANGSPLDYSSRVQGRLDGAATM